MTRLEAASRLMARPTYFFLPGCLCQDGALAVRQLEGVSLLLAREGWAQGEMRTSSGWCLVGALNEVAGEASLGTAWWLLHLMVAARSGLDAIPVWNDVPGRTSAEVLELVADAVEFARTWKAMQ